MSIFVNKPYLLFAGYLSNYMAWVVFPNMHSVFSFFFCNIGNLYKMQFHIKTCHLYFLLCYVFMFQLINYCVYLAFYEANYVSTLVVQVCF